MLRRQQDIRDPGLRAIGGNTGSVTAGDLSVPCRFVTAFCWVNRGRLGLESLLRET